jgi:hypothetical protein
MKPRFINNLPVENFFWGSNRVVKCRGQFRERLKLGLYLQGFAEIFILQTATDQALLT